MWEQSATFVGNCKITFAQDYVFTIYNVKMTRSILVGVLCITYTFFKQPQMPTYAHQVTSRRNHSFPLSGRLSHQQQSLRTNYTKNWARDNDIPLSANLSASVVSHLCNREKNPWGSFYQITSWPLNLSWRRSFNFMQRNEQLKWQEQHWSGNERGRILVPAGVTPAVWPWQARPRGSAASSGKGDV